MNRSPPAATVDVSAHPTNGPPVPATVSTPKTRFGVFVGPWDTGHGARDGAVLSFQEAEEEARRIFAPDGPHAVDLVCLDLSLFRSLAELSRTLADLDVVHANCGPLTAFLMGERARHGLDLRIVREVRTLGWIGYAFQEYVARELCLSGDVCVHPSEYSANVWRAFRGDANDVYYNPRLDNEPASIPQVVPSSRPVLGYFSRISRDKGFHRLPELVARLNRHGWAVASVQLCGRVESPGLLQRVVGDLEGSGVAVTYHGELAHDRALGLMETVDVVLSLTTSSFESAGRIVAEAYHLGRVVIAADYCAGHDVVAKDYRIPLVSGHFASGRSDVAFEVADLDLDGWTVPALARAGDDSRFRDDFHRSRVTLPGLVAGDVAGSPAVDVDAEHVRMAIDWDDCTGRTVEAWCGEVHANLIATLRGREDLLDLGGTMKRSLLEAGFNPTVTFRG